jgi:cytoskeletal protein CcmA (bactofilin family)
MFRRGDDRGEEERQERHERERHERQEPIQPKEVGMSEGGRQGGAAAGSEVTVVGQGARIEGTLVSAGSLRIDGQVKGKIKAEGDVTLSAQSTVDADIQAQNVTVAGTFKGNITAQTRAELARGGRVEGNVTSKVLVVAEGAVFSGQSIMGETVSKAATATVPQAEDKPAEPVKA